MESGRPELPRVRPDRRRLRGISVRPPPASLVGKRSERGLGRDRPGGCVDARHRSPLPFVSGHTLFATYAVLTARRWPLRALALLVLAEVAYVKVFASGDWRSMLAGLAVAGIAAAARAPSPARR